MPPIDVPMTRRRWFTPEAVGQQRVFGVDHVAIADNAETSSCRPSLGLLDLSVADVVGQHDEVASWRRAAGPRRNSAPAKPAPQNCAPVPPVPCMISTALRTTPCASFFGVP